MENDFLKKHDPESIFWTCVVWGVGLLIALVYQIATKS